MKGLIGFIFAMFFLTLLVGALVTSHITSTTYSTSILAKEMKILSILEQIEAVKIGAKYLLNYSFQQGIYDTAKFGIFSKNYEDLIDKNSESDRYPILREFDNVYLEDINKLDFKIAEYFKKSLDNYVKELSNKFGINIDFYKISLEKVEKNESKYELNVEGNITYYGDFFVINDTLREKINVSNIVNDFYRIVFYLKRKFIDADVVKEAILYGIQSLPDECKQVEKIFCENEYLYLDPIDLHNVVCPDFLDRIKETMNKSLYALLQENYNFNISFKIDSFSAHYNYSIESYTEESESCGCKQIGLEELTSQQCDTNEEEYCKGLGYYSGVCKNNFILCYNCSKYYDRITIKIEYNYLVNSKLLFDFYSEEKYPVYDIHENNIKLRPVTFKFSIISSN